jgi:hypothetical protein
VAAPTADALRAGLERLESELAAAVRLADAGLGPAADLPAVFARHAAALAPDVLDQAREVAGSAELRPLAAWAVALHGRRAGAEHEALARRWRATAVARGPGGGAEVPYAEVDAALAATADRGARLAVDAARAAAAATGYARLARERFARERGAVEALGIADGYLATWEALTGVDARAAAAAAAAFTRDTSGAWADALAEAARRRLGAAPGDLPGGLQRGDEPVLLADPALDAAFPAGAALAAARTQAAAMGLDPAAGGRLRADVGPRPGQRPGAWWAAVRVPGEVYVGWRPRAGVAAWRSLLGAHGAALHAAHAGADAPAEARYAGDAAVRLGVGRLFAGLLADEGWLRRYAGLDRARAEAARRHAGFVALREARREAAALRLAVAVLAGEVPASEAADAGVVLVREATGARAPAADLVDDAAPWLRPAARVRGALFAAWAADALRERFDEDWWRNPRAGPWVAAELCAGGNVAPPAGPFAPPAADAGGAAGEPLDGAASVARAVRAAEAALS